MYNISFDKPIHVYFMGIGGISMSGLAEILLSRGFKISGSDMKASALTDHLAEKGASVAIGQCAENITDDIDLIVYTAAISNTNPEMIAAKAKNIPMLTRAELLGEIMNNYKIAIGVSGTHGKTTTTSMMTEILMSADFDPTVSVGGILPSIGGNLRIGGSDTFLTEACEYTNSFLSFFPTIEIILNIEEDHMDFFKDINDIRNSFTKFAELLPKDGLLVINGDIDNYEEITRNLECKVITVGSDSACDYTACNIRYDAKGCCSYTLVNKGKELGVVSLAVPGIHNVYNSLAAIAVGIHLGIDLAHILAGLSAFTGTDRRFQYKGECRGFTIVDDYAHHPAEIKATINASSNMEHNRLVVIFQPHTYTRTKAFLNDFAAELSKADEVVLADIYAAREINTIGISSLDLKHEIDKLGTKCCYFASFDEIENYILDTCTPGDLVITMGAGNIIEVGENLLKKA